MLRFSPVRRAVLDPRLAGRRGLPWAVLTIAVGALLRFALEPFVEGVPFLTFFPAVQVGSLLLGWRWGAFVLVASALAANFLFQAPTMAFSFGPNEIAASVSFMVAGALMIWASESLRRAILSVEEAARRERELNLELAHRVNNSLTVIQGLARQTARVHPEPHDFYEAFSGRLLALSEANKVLMSGDTEVAGLPDLAVAAMRPFSARQMTLGGPRCALPAAASVPLVLALHELGTNATKYGALSTVDGRVDLSWWLDGATCHICWREIGGPPVTAPTRKGLGTRLLSRQTGLDAVEMTFDPRGLRCEISVGGAERLS